ncbi:MFS transporter [Rothia sp. (in: high G+C Gram-positive bacteria)]|uniref:MFS transporter n=1 Tax=unclassified Rothia (in: high G+C Gram-positive bacteria) TaxID=2689056 RepID=UPI0026C8F209
MSKHIPTPSMDTGAIPVIPQSVRNESLKDQPPRPQPTVKVPTQIKVLIAASFLIALGYGLVAPVLPSFARSFDVGAMAATFVVSAFALTRLLFAPTSGKLITRFGERKIYSTGLLIVALGSLGAGLSVNYPMLIASRAVGGIGSVMFTVAAMGILVRNSPPAIRGRVSGYYATSFLLGNILGPVLGALAAGWGMRMPFFVYALLLFGAATVVLTKLKEELQEVNLNTQGIAVPKKALTFKEAWGFTNFRSALFTNFAVGWSVFGLQSSVIPLAAVAVLADFHRNETGYDAAARGATLAGFTLAAYAAGNALTQIYSGKMGDRIGRRPMIFAGLLLSGSVTLVFGFINHPAAFVATAVLLGIGSALLGPSLQACLSDVIGNKRSGGQPLAYYQMVSDIGLIIGPLIAGAIIDAAGFFPAFVLCAGLLLVASLGWLPGFKPKFPADVAEEGYTGK